MTAKELIEYLQGFEESAVLSIMIVNSQKRVLHNVDKFGAITDMEQPVFFVETTTTQPLDEEYEQMELLDAIMQNEVEP